MAAPLPDTLLNALPLSVIVVDNAGAIKYFNEAARQLISSDTLEIDKPLNAVLPNSDLLFHQLNHDRNHEVHQTVHLGDDILSVQGTALPDNYWLLTLSSTSEIGQPDSAKYNLLGEVAHDLKQPLAAVASFSDVVEASGELNTRQKQYLDRVRGAAARMSEQVYQLLDLAWIETGMKLTLANVDVVNLVRIVTEDLEAKFAEKHIQLDMTFGADVPLIVADSIRITQVITNLLTNAIKYSLENTTVSVDVHTNDNGSKVILSVRDQGFGIAPEHLPNLFGRFYRVESKQTRRIEGTGLGLFITRSIVEQHGGQISVESAPEKGSLFTVTLPIKSAIQPAG